MHMLNQIATIWVCSKQNSQSYGENYLLHLEEAVEVEQEQVLMSPGQVRNRHYDHFMPFSYLLFYRYRLCGVCGVSRSPDQEPPNNSPQVSFCRKGLSSSQTRLHLLKPL